MTGIALRPRVILVACFLITQMVDSISGQDQAGRYDLLRGTNNESSCQLKDTIHSTCNFSITPPPLNVTPTASLCTCNKIFFNIWSACSYASGNFTLPVFSLWTSTCLNHYVNLAESTSLSTFKGGLGIEIPVWAVPDVPGNTTFDLQKAVVLVHLAPKPWSTLQIIAPLIAALLSVILTLLSVSIYRHSKLGKVQWRDEFVHRLRPPQKVKSMRQSVLGPEWEIEPQEPGIYEEVVTKKVDETFVFVDRSPSPVSPDTIPDTIPGHPSRYSESSAGTRERTAGDRPGVGRGDPFAPPYQIQARPLMPVRHLPGTAKNPIFDLHRNRGWRFPGSSSFKGIHIPRPWKRGPEKLVEVQPTRRFRVDPPSLGSGIDQSTESSEAAGDSAATSYPQRSFDIADHLERESDSLDNHDYVQEGDEDVGSDDEGTNLISPEQREERRSSDVATTKSLFARSSGTSTVNTTSIHSNINIVSPTVSSSSPRSTRIIGTPSKATFPVIPPIIPPLPTQPAPAVPANIFRRILRRENNDETSIPQQPLLLPERFTMTPIQEDRSGESVRRSPSPAPIRSNSNDQQSTSTNGPGPSHVVPSLKRMRSEELQRRSPSPAPSTSGQALPYYLRAHQRAPSPSPSLHENSANASPRSGPSRLLPFEPLSPAPMYYRSHQRSASASASLASMSRSSDDIYGDPDSPKPPARRGLSADDAVSFDLAPESSLSAVPPRNGSPRPQVGRENARALFPASGRGAARYRGMLND